MDRLQALIAGWPMIRANLPTFFVIVLVLIGAIWGIFELRYRTIIANRDSIIANRDSEIALLNRRILASGDKSAEGSVPLTRCDFTLEGVGLWRMESGSINCLDIAPLLGAYEEGNAPNPRKVHEIKAGDRPNETAWYFTVIFEKPFRAGRITGSTVPSTPHELMLVRNNTDRFAIVRLKWVELPARIRIEFTP
jgi:hypothetical protein